eukprot:2121369-Rhodomonas_salina.1
MRSNRENQRACADVRFLLSPEPSASLQKCTRFQVLARCISCRIGVCPSGPVRGLGAVRGSSTMTYPGRRVRGRVWVLGQSRPDQGRMPCRSCCGRIVFVGMVINFPTEGLPLPHSLLVAVNGSTSKNTLRAEGRGSFLDCVTHNSY